MRPRQRYEHVSTDVLARAVAAGMADPIANARAQKRIVDLLHEFPDNVPESGHPTRDDLRFMADCLGLRPGVDYRAHEYMLSDTASLADAVNGRMLDPIANGRAWMRIASHIAALPRMPTGLAVFPSSG